MKKLSVLGSTGSIGTNVLDLVYRFPEHFQIASLAAGANIALLKHQIESFHPRKVAVIDKETALNLKRSLSPASAPQILHGPEGYCEVAADTEAELVVSAIVGAAGLGPTMAAIAAGKNIALANKEVLVMAGALVMKMAKARGVSIFPIDSEHSAVYQCLNGNTKDQVKKIILTASGGPFLDCSFSDLQKVTVAQAIQHPKWNMGKKVTIDSASLMNKGLEVIEARWLFDIPIDKIDVLVHPQSIVHSMVEFVDGAVLAQLGKPDMKIPIAYALSCPERLLQAGPSLGIADLSRLDFFPPDLDRFPNLRLAYHAGTIGGTMPAVLNAANEVAVQEFLEGRIGFMDISGIVESALEKHLVKEPMTMEDVIEADRSGRRHALEGAEKYYGV